MAVAIKSKGTLAIGAYTSGNITITKPTGLAVGDLMIVHIGVGATSSNSTFTKTGWVGLDGSGTFTLASSTDTQARSLVGYKVADSDDVAASNFVFTGAGSSNTGQLGAVIFRIDGQDPTPISAYLAGHSDNDDTPSFATGITPSASCLLLMLNMSRGSSASGTGSYAITTSNPSWTEEYDQDGGLEIHSAASATRPESTSTGAWSYTVNGASSSDSDCGSVLVAILPLADVTITPDALSLSGATKAPTATAGATVSVSAAVGLSASPQGPTVSTPDATWTNQDKSSTGWTNLTKS